MSDSAAALLELARAFGVQLPPSHFAEDGRLVVMGATFHVGPFRVFAVARPDAIQLSFEPVAQRLILSINRPGIYHGPAEEITRVDSMTVYGYPRLATVLPEAAPPQVEAWLRAAENRAALAALALAPEDHVRVDRNVLDVTVAPHRATRDLIDRLTVWAQRLPPVVPADLLEGVEALPTELRPLAKHFAKWAEGDDLLRAAKVQAARPAALRKLCREVMPLLPTIEAHLASRPTSVQTMADIRLGWLADLAAEIDAQEA